MNNKLDVRDLVNTGLYTILAFILIFIGGMIGFIPVLMPLVLASCGLLSGPVNMLFATKIKKPGMILIYTIIIALLFVATGHTIFILLTAVIFGFIAEWILKKGKYNSIRAAKLAFSTALISLAGNILPIYFARAAYLKEITERMGAEYAEKMFEVFPLWSILPILIVGFLGSYLGCTLGVKMLKKHFIKAGMIEKI